MSKHRSFCEVCTSHQRSRIAFGLTLIAICAAFIPQASVAQLANNVPPEIDTVGIDEHRGDTLPLDLQFVDHRGQAIRLGDLFDGRRPVILSLNYSDCPMLCNLQLRGLNDSLKQIEGKLGERFRVVTASINPNETPERAAGAQQNYVQTYGRETTEDAWTLLTGKEAAIKQLADAVGFRYEFVPERGEYAHTAALMICTPDGVISRYLYGIDYDPSTLRLSTIEAADGKIGSAVDQLILYCFHYDATKGRYAPAAFNLMRVGALFTLVVIGIGFVILRQKEGFAGGETGEAASDGHPEGPQAAEDHQQNEAVSAFNHSAPQGRGL